MPRKVRLRFRVSIWTKTLSGLTATVKPDETNNFDFKLTPISLSSSSSSRGSK